MGSVHNGRSVSLVGSPESRGLMNVKLSAAPKEQFQKAFLFLVCLMISSIPFYLQLQQKFSLQLFFLSLCTLHIAGLFAYVFFQSILTPKVQVYPNMVIISGLSRQVIKIADLINCSYQNGILNLSYLEKNTPKESRIKIREKISVIFTRGHLEVIKV